MVCRPIRSTADIDIANRTWKYGNEDSTAFIHHLAHQYPSAYLGTEQGQHIGHVLGIGCNSSGNRMAVKLCKRNLPELLSWLNQHLPHSYKIHGELRSHLRGQFPDLEFFVDRWPCPQAALARVDPDGQQLKPNHAQGDQGEKNILGTRFPPNYFLSLLRAAVLVPDDLEGMVCRPISSAADIDIVSRTWKYGNEDSTAFIHHLAHQYPSLYLSTEQGQHIGHILGVSCDTAGVLYLNPECRHKGCAKIMSTHVLQRFLKCREEAVYGVVEESNKPALKFNLSLGCKVETKLVCMHTSPKEY
ncbi:hypothetical protein ACOMHN_045352 [Nucella lapillus]